MISCMVCIWTAVDLPYLPRYHRKVNDEKERALRSLEEALRPTPAVDERSIQMAESRGWTPDHDDVPGPHFSLRCVTFVLACLQDGG